MKFKKLLLDFPGGLFLCKILLLLKKLCYNKGIMKAKCILSTMALTLIGAGFTGSSALALTEQSEAALEFTFAPSLTLSVSDSDLIIENLMPGTSDISNTVDVTVATNAIYGYSLFATTGNTTYPTRNLVRDNNNFLESIATDSNTATLGNDTWGYTIDGGTTYSGLPLYTSTSKELNSSYGPVDAITGKTSFAIGAKASANKASGNYNNVVNFTAISKVSLPTIQSFTTATCPTLPTLVVDSRDGIEYHIQKLADGKCWMLDNLALDLTNSTVLNGLTTNNTNATETSLTALRSGNRAAGDQYATAGVGNLTSGDSHSVPRTNMDSKDVVPSDAPTNGAGYNKIGGYYNYCAASAGSYCYGNGNSAGTSSGNATEDICPKNWRMPTSNTGEYGALANAIYGSTGETSNATKVANYRNALSLPFSGHFYNGLAHDQGKYGYFWSSTRYSNDGMYYSTVRTSYVNPSAGINHYFGYSVRCLAGV